MLVSRNHKSSHSTNIENILEERFFITYIDGEMKYAMLYKDIDEIKIKVIDTLVTRTLKWKNDILFTQNNEPLTLELEDTIIGTIPIWWPENVCWPPSIRAFYNLDNVHDLIDGKYNSLRTSTTWDDAFIKSSENMHPCACGNECKVFSNSCYVLKNEYNKISFRLSGRYDKDLFTINDGYDADKYDKVKTNICNILKGLYIDQKCLWKKVTSLELRSNYIKMKSLWLRCVIHYINQHICDCINFMEFHESRIMEKNKKKIKNVSLRSGTIIDSF